MAYVYANLIKKGAINPKTGKPYMIDDVPFIIRAEVEKNFWLRMSDENAV